MEQKNITSGSVKISKNVMVTIIRNALAEIEGVHSLAVRFRDTARKLPIAVTLDADVAVIDIAVNLCSGFRLKDVAGQIQQRVKDNVQDMTGIPVSRVNVLVADMLARPER